MNPGVTRRAGLWRRAPGGAPCGARGGQASEEEEREARPVLQGRGAAGGQDRFAVAVLVLQELESPAIRRQAVDGRLIFRQDERIVQNGRRRFHRGVHLEGIGQDCCFGVVF